MRIKIFTGWCALYAALAAAFVWLHSASPKASWIVALAGIAITLLMWSADVRNRSALRASKDAGAAIEATEAAAIPPDQRFFVRQRTEGCIEKLLTHSVALNLFALGALGFFCVAAAYLYSTGGVLPK
jgi:hypothetical protein